MKRIIIALSVVLVGCATQPPPPTYAELRQRAKNVSTDNLCKATINKPFLKEVSEEELRERGATCDWEKVKMMLEEERYRQAEFSRAKANQDAANAALMKSASDLLKSSQPAPTANCRTVFNNNVANTVCY